MERVTVSKDELIKIITKNRASHKAAYAEASNGYQRAVIAELHSQIQAIENDKSHRVVITEFPPTDHTTDYDKALRMLSMSVDDKVQITSVEFTHFVDDDWDWKRAWVASTRKYLEK